MSTIKYWIENIIEVSNDTEEMPEPHYRPISFIKVSLLWSLYYLRNNFTYEKAVKDIILRGGDTRSNAAIVGGLIGAANGFNKEKMESIQDIDGLLLTINQIVEHAPDTTSFRVKWSEKSMDLATLKTHYEQEFSVPL